MFSYATPRSSRTTEMSFYDTSSPPLNFDNYQDQIDRYSNESFYSGPVFPTYERGAHPSSILAPTMPLGTYEEGLMFCPPNSAPSLATPMQQESPALSYTGGLSLPMTTTQAELSTFVDFRYDTAIRLQMFMRANFCSQISARIRRVILVRSILTRLPLRVLGQISSTTTAAIVTNCFRTIAN